MLRRSCTSVFLAHFLVLCCSWAYAQETRDQTPKAIFARGEQALVNHQYAFAEKDFKRVIALGSSTAPAYANLGVVYLRTNRPQSAIRALRTAEKLAPRTAGIHLNLGLAYFRQNEFKKAAAQFGDVISEDPGNVQSRYLKGTCHFMTDDFKQAVAAFEPIAPSEQNDLEFLYMLGVSYGMLKETTQARSIFEQLVKTGGDTPNLHLLLGRAYLALKENDKAEVELQQATIGDALPFAHYYLGVLYRKSGRYDQAAKEFEREIKVAPDNPWGYKDLSDLMLDRGDPAAAVPVLEKGTVHDPQSSELFANLGRAYRDVGNLKGSTVAFRRAIALDPEESSYHFQLGRSLSKAGFNREARTEIARGRDLDTKAAETQMQALARDHQK